MSIQVELNTLQRTLNYAIDTFRQELVAADLPLLSLQATERHPLDKYDYLPSPRLYEARRLILAGIGQLKSLVQYPFEKVYEETLSVYNHASLEVMVETGLADYLGSVPDRKKGAHVSDIQKALNLDTRKITIVLRYLSTEGWVRETEEGVFALNRPAFELLDGANGRKVVRTMYVPEIASSLLKWLQHPEWRYSDSVVHTPVQMVHKTNLPLFQWLKTQPEAFVRMAEGIRASGDSYIRGITADYPWESLQGRTIVDCGGGQGLLSIHLAKTFPSLRFVVQDLPEVVELTKSHIASTFPSPSDAGRVLAEAQDFFKPQARKGDGYNYVFRYVLHDWADNEAIKILKNIAAAAGPQSKIIIIETISTPSIITPYSSTDKMSILSSLGDRTYSQIPAPPLIPANFGSAARSREALVLHLLSLANAHGRTLTDWKRLINISGLEVQRVVPLRADVSVIECAIQTKTEA